jgi:hypothetical protein
VLGFSEVRALLSTITTVVRVAACDGATTPTVARPATAEIAIAAREIRVSFIQFLLVE